MSVEVSRADQATLQNFFRGRTRTTGVTEDNVNTVITGDTVTINGTAVSLEDGLSLTELDALFGSHRQVDTIVAEGWRVSSDAGEGQTGADAVTITVEELDRMNGDIHQYATYLTTLRPSLSGEEALTLARSCYSAAPTLERRSLTAQPTIDQLSHRIEGDEGGTLTVRTRAALGITGTESRGAIALVEAYISEHSDAEAIARYILWLEEASHYTPAVRTESFEIAAPATFDAQDAVFAAVRRMQAEAAEDSSHEVATAVPTKPIARETGAPLAPTPTPATPVAPTTLTPEQATIRREAWIAFFESHGMTIEDHNELPREVLITIDRDLAVAQRVFMEQGLNEAQWNALRTWATTGDTPPCRDIPEFSAMQHEGDPPRVTWQKVSVAVPRPAA
jgi:hypothetical protein